MRNPFAQWYLFDRDCSRGEDHGPQRFSLIYLCADGVAAYQALYWQYHTAAAVLTIIQPGTGFCCDYTQILDSFHNWKSGRAFRRANKNSTHAGNNKLESAAAATSETASFHAYFRYKARYQLLRRSAGAPLQDTMQRTIALLS